MVLQKWKIHSGWCLPTVQSSRHLKHSYLFTVKLSLHKKLLALYHKESEPEPPDCDEICVSVMSVLYLKWTVLLELKLRVQAFCTSHLFWLSIALSKATRHCSSRMWHLWLKINHKTNYKYGNSFSYMTLAILYRECSLWVQTKASWQPMYIKISNWNYTISYFPCKHRCLLMQ